MRFVPAATAFVPIAWLIAASAAVACTCVYRGLAADHVAATSLIFKGRVTGITRGEYEAVTRFQVLEVLKGQASRTVRIRHQISDASCGVTFRHGTTALVFANRGRDGAWSTSLCSSARFSEADYRRAAALPISAKNTVNVPVAPLTGMSPAAAVDPLRGSITFRRLLSESEARRVLGAAGARPYVIFMSIDSLQGSHRVPEAQSSLDILADARRQLATQVGGTGARGATASRARALVVRSTAEQLARNPRELSLARALLASAERDEKAAAFAQADGPFIYGVEFLGGFEVQRRLRLAPEVHRVQVGFIVRGRRVAPDPENLAYRPPGSADSPVAQLNPAEVYAKLRALAELSAPSASVHSTRRPSPPVRVASLAEGDLDRYEALFRKMSSQHAQSGRTDTAASCIAIEEPNRARVDPPAALVARFGDVRPRIKPHSACQFENVVIDRESGRQAIIFWAGMFTCTSPNRCTTRGGYNVAELSAAAYQFTLGHVPINRIPI